MLLFYFMEKQKKLLSLLLMTILFNCGTYFNQPVDIQEARQGEVTNVSEDLKSLPLPQQQVVVGVYNFRDQTGQFKATENGSTFSTAVTQGGTTILLKALEDSKWFIPIERENINNLLNERQIIETTRNQYSKRNGTRPEPLKPLLFAGVLLEGGIVSYDTNIVTGGLGARYFGIGGSTQYRQDRVTVYLRVVSTNTGEILRTVYVSKTILSQALDASLFRFVKFQRLLEAETGFTRNEPVQLAVTEAIEKAVRSLIIEGLEEGLWFGKKEDSKDLIKLIEDYHTEHDIANSTRLYEREYKPRRGKSVINFSGGASLFDGDLGNSRPEVFGRIGYKRFLDSNFDLNFSVNQFNLKAQNSFNEPFTSIDFNVGYTALPYDDLTPYIYAGFGANFADSFSVIDPKFQYGLGLEYLLTDGIGLNLFAEHNIAFSDELDGIAAGRRDDFFYRFGLGLNFYLFSKDKNSKQAEEKKRKNELKELRKTNIRALKKAKQNDVDSENEKLTDTSNN